MENHIFRSAISGFNRQDVMEYIEKVQKGSAEIARRLEEESDELRRSESELRLSLSACEQEKDELARRLEELTNRYDEARINWEQEARDGEALRGELVQRDKDLRDELARRDETIQTMTTENERLTQRLKELENEVNNARREKEKIAQLELEAYLRSERILATAQEKAEDTGAQANALAEEVIQVAQENAQKLTAETTIHVAQLRRELEEQIADVVDQYSSLRSSVELITSQVGSELQKLSVTVAQLPANFDHMKAGLQELLERTREKETEETEE